MLNDDCWISRRIAGLPGVKRSTDSLGRSVELMARDLLKFEKVFLLHGLSPDDEEGKNRERVKRQMKLSGYLGGCGDEDSNEIQ